MEDKDIKAKKLIIIGIAFTLVFMLLTIMLIIKANLMAKKPEPPKVAQPENIAPPLLNPKGGMYAIALDKSNYQQLSGYLKPGTTVNIILAYKSKVKEVGVTTKTLLSNICVLGLSPVIGKDKKTGSILLEVTAREAEILSSAEELGTISLAPSGQSCVGQTNIDDQLARKQTRYSVETVIAKVDYALKQIFPGIRIKLTPILDTIQMTGIVTSQEQAQEIKDVVTQLLPPYISLLDMLKIQPKQVLLKVQVMEMSKKVQDDLGLNWAAIFNSGSVKALGIGYGTILPDEIIHGMFAKANIKSSHFNIDALVRMLASEGLVTIISEPNLTTTSGKSAKFLAGGQIPILIAQGNYINTVEYKDYGVSLKFTPTVEPDHTIQLDIVPEVSNISDSGAVEYRGYKVPALLTRRAETTVRLKNGQTYAIAGLTQNHFNQLTDKVKGLSDIKIVGELFKSSYADKTDTDLIILITPYLLDTHAQKIPARKTAARQTKSREFITG